MTDRLTPEQAAELLGIPDADVPVFARLVDALRTPGVPAEPGDYRMSTREQRDEQPDDGEFLDDFTSGRPD